MERPRQGMLVYPAYNPKRIVVDDDPTLQTGVSLGGGGINLGTFQLPAVALRWTDGSLTREPINGLNSLDDLIMTTETKLAGHKGRRRAALDAFGL